VSVLVLLRHGHSEWNITGRFTGWTDIALTGLGIGEAEEAGRTLAAAGIAFDEAHVSALRRTRQTALATLAAMGEADIPVHECWRLNERHYGALQGLNKDEIFATWGEERSHAWWRGYYEPPPPVADDDPRHPRFDPRYAGVDRALLPAGESLSDCQRRALPYLNDIILPRLTQGKRLLLVSHGNTLRGLVMHLDRLSPDAIETLEIPSGVPLLYRFADDGSVQEKAWLE